MAESIVALLAEVVPLVARGVGVALAAIVGTSVELNGLHRIASDPSLIGFWVVWMGVLLLYAGYVLASDLGVALRAPDAT